MKSKIIFTFVLVLTLIFTISLTSCGDRDYDEAEVIEASRELLLKSIEVNKVFYGEGLIIDEDTNFSNGSYYPAYEPQLENMSFSDIEGLKKLTESVYTKELSELIFSTKLSSVEDESYVISLARYYQRDDEFIRCIMVYKDAEVLYTNEVDYDYDSIKVIGADGEYIKISVDTVLTDKEGSSEKVNIELILLEEENGFRLDTLSFTQK